MSKNTPKISDPVKIWRDLKEQLGSFTDETKEKFERRYNMALNDEHTLFGQYFWPEIYGGAISNFWDWKSIRVASSGQGRIYGGRS